MIRFLISLTLLLSAQAFAHGHDHDHDHGDTQAPEGTQLTLVGQDPTNGQACFLYVSELPASGTPAGQFSAKVLTSFSHNSARPNPFQVRFVAGRSDMLGGQNGKDIIAIGIQPGSTDLRDAKFFNLKWWHFNHFDLNRCVNLQVDQH